MTNKLVNAVWPSVPSIQLEKKEDFEALLMTYTYGSCVLFSDGRKRGFLTFGVMICEPQNPIEGKK